jgi:hypothetical protein
MGEKLLKRPNSGGWWDWFERGCGTPERILVADGGRYVVYDDAWTKAMGRKPNEVLCENYWEGTETTQAMMPGSWRKVTKEPPHA